MNRDLLLVAAILVATIAVLLAVNGTEPILMHVRQTMVHKTGAYTRTGWMVFTFSALGLASVVAWMVALLQERIKG